MSVGTLINFVPAIISAAWMTTDSDMSVATLPGPPSTMVFIEQLTPQKLLTIGHDTRIKNVRALPVKGIAQTENRAGFTLALNNGAVRIARDSENPGEALIIFLLPLLILSVFLTICMTVILMRHSMHKVWINDENSFLLEQARLKLITGEKRFSDVSECDEVQGYFPGKPVALPI